MTIITMAMTRCQQTILGLHKYHQACDLTHQRHQLTKIRPCTTSNKEHMRTATLGAAPKQWRGRDYYFTSLLLRVEMYFGTSNVILYFILLLGGGGHLSCMCKTGPAHDQHLIPPPPSNMGFYAEFMAYRKKDENYQHIHTQIQPKKAQNILFPRCCCTNSQRLGATTHSALHVCHCPLALVEVREAHKAEATRCSIRISHDCRELGIKEVSTDTN